MAATIDEWLAMLDSPQADRDYRPGHERMLALLAELSLRQPRLRIRVAGTNGKGSTCNMLAAALSACGLRVGLYTSPHLFRFNERIRVDGMPIEDAQLLHDLAELVPLARRIDASYFETATALALRHFSRTAVDVEILEAGVGARLDATTAVPADMALITPIGMDHQAWLGESLAQIGWEKGHALCGCRWTVSAEQMAEVAEVLLPFHPNLHWAHTGDFTLSLALSGAHQRINAAVVWRALQLLAAESELPIDPTKAALAMQSVQVAGRLQRIDGDRAHIWLDAAHNRHAIEAIAPALPGLSACFRAIFVFTREDRSLVDALPLLRPHGRILVGTEREAGSGFDRCYPTIEAALAAELADDEGGDYLVLGSFITVAATARWLQASGFSGQVHQSEIVQS